MDGGSVERWEDPKYREVYKEILKGNWENFDPWEIGILVPLEVVRWGLTR